MKSLFEKFQDYVPDQKTDHYIVLMERFHLYFMFTRLFSNDMIYVFYNEGQVVGIMRTNTVGMVRYAQKVSSFECTQSGKYKVTVTVPVLLKGTYKVIGSDCRDRKADCVQELLGASL